MLQQEAGEQEWLALFLQFLTLQAESKGICEHVTDSSSHLSLIMVSSIPILLSFGFTSQYVYRLSASTFYAVLVGLATPVETNILEIQELALAVSRLVFVLLCLSNA